MQSIDNLLKIVIFLIVLNVVGIPLVQQSIAEQNYTGMLGVVTANIPTFMGIAGLVVAAYAAVHE